MRIDMDATAPESMAHRTENELALEPFSAVFPYKLNPPKASAVQVTRSALCELVSGNEQTRLVIIHAPAGFGKTTLMLQACARLEQQSVRCAWISLDDADSDPARFMLSLAYAFERISGDAQSGEPASLFASERSLGDLMLKLFNRLARFDAPFALFLDDFETIQLGAVRDILREFVDHLPPRGRLVLGSRRLPELGLGRLRATGQLCELGPEHLRFSLCDTTHFLCELRGLALDRAVVERLHDRTEGWIAALWLASVALENQLRPADFVAGFSGTSTAVAEYLAEDVLAKLGAEEREFLLRTSILDTLSASLCDAVCEHRESQVLLDRLARANVFLTPLDGERRRFRYHKLFAQFLREQLQRQAPDKLSRLHRAAAQWYRAEGQPIPAIEHALAADDADYAAVLLDENAEWLLGESRTRLLMRWLDRAPAEVLAAKPRLHAVYLWTTAFTRSTKNGLDKLDALKAHAAEDPVIEAYILALRPLLLMNLDRVEEAHAIGQKNFDRLAPLHAFAYITLANTMAHLSFMLGRYDDARGYLDASHRAQGQNRQCRLHLAYSEAVEGEIDFVHARLRQATARYRLGIGDREIASSGTFVVCVPMADSLYEVDEREQAERMLRICLPQIRELRMPDHLMCVHIMLARLMALRGDTVGALQLLGELEQLGYAAELPRIVATAKIECARMAILRGDIAMADVELQRVSSMDCSRQMTQWSTIVNDLGTPTIGRLRWMIHAGSAQAAVPLLREELAQSERAGRLRRALKLRILLALGLRESNEPRKALDALDDALKRSADEGFLRIYADEGPRMASLLGEYVAALPLRASSRSNGVCRDYLDSLAKACRGNEADHGDTPGPASDRPVLVEMLTPAEIKVLKLLGEGLSNLAMAKRLFVSETTVRTHLRSINAKLDAKSRTQAVAIGRRLGLTP